ncbi:MAG: GAF domain-containing protein [Candidatus Omnitrophica bacterium]|nr:GAF domain-containing protein [Candidatus Omnitrophota bacterium]
MVLKNRKIENKLVINPSKILFVLNNISEYASKKMRSDIIPLLDFTLKEIINLMNAKVGNIRLYNTSAKKLLLVASYGTSKEYKKMKFSIETGESIAGHVFKTGKIYFAQDLKANHLYAFSEFSLKEKINSLVCIPLVTKDKKFGVLSIYYPKPKKFTNEEMEFFSILGSFLSNFIASQTMQYRLHKIYISIATTLINILEEKGSYHRGHSEKVKEIAIKIAEKMKLSRDKIQIISDFGILHDIGKVGIDPSILNKPDKLTREEWEIIKKHPINGMHIISPIEEYIKDISFIKSHHEQPNGNGYPERLKDSRIPIWQEFFSVADAFEAMIADRPYRKALSLEQAKNELVENIEKQFDRKVVKVVLNLIDSGELNEFI